MDVDLTLKDPIHGYIELDVLERKIIDAPWYQRLKHVHQNDVSKAVYPGMHTRRFEHSLGAMHLAGRCIATAFERTSPDTVLRFLDELETDLRPSAAPGLFRVSDSEFDYEKIKATAVRIVRVYGALHDIGHPPYSHLLERCFSFSDIDPTAAAQLAPEKTKAWHELNALDLADTQVRSVLSLNGLDEVVYGTAVLLMKGEHLSPVLKGIKTLVDAVIDVDRMDYIVRDGRSSGADFGTYDLGRLVTSFRIVLDDDEGVITKVHIRPNAKALSAIESLLQERHKIYRWIHFHPRVILAKAVVRYILSELTAGFPQAVFDPKHFQSRHYYSDGAGQPYLFLDDPHVDRLVTSAGMPLLDLSKLTDDRERRLATAFRIHLLREKWGLTLWKGRDEYAGFNSILQSAFQRLTSPPDDDQVIARHGSYANWIGDFVIRFGEPARGLLEEVQSRLNTRKDWFLVEATEGFSTKGRDEVITTDMRQSVSLGQVSTVASGIETAWREDIHLYGFKLSLESTRESMSDAAISKERESGREELATALVDVFKTDGTVRGNLIGFLQGRDPKF